MQAVVVVDPFASGLCLAQQAMDRGFACIAVYSDASQDWLVRLPLAVRRTFAANVTKDLAMPLDQLVAAVRAVGLEVVGVLAGAESGVHLADSLSEALGVRTSGSAGFASRRNKFVIGETIRAAGLRAIKQCRALTWEHAETFLRFQLRSLSSCDAVLKPLESGGSDDVVLAHTMAEANDTLDAIVGKVNQLGLTNTYCLVQEFLAGPEYVVDTVSLDGDHKVIAVWEVDKRPVNGAAFVRFGMWLRPVTCAKTLALVKYTLQVLDAVGIRNGPGHTKVIWTSDDEPCLVGVGAHGGSGADAPILTRAQGYTIASATLDAFFKPAAFHALPRLPSSLRTHGVVATLVSYDGGFLHGMPGLQEIQEMASVVETRIESTAGVTVAPTIDAFTTPGTVLLVHADKDTLDKDYRRLHALERHGLFEIGDQEKERKTPKRAPRPTMASTEIRPDAQRRVVAARGGKWTATTVSPASENATTPASSSSDPSASNPFAGFGGFDAVLKTLPPFPVSVAPFKSVTTAVVPPVATTSTPSTPVKTTPTSPSTTDPPAFTLSWVGAKAEAKGTAPADEAAASMDLLDEEFFSLVQVDEIPLTGSGGFTFGVPTQTAKVKRGSKPLARGKTGGFTIGAKTMSPSTAPAVTPFTFGAKIETPSTFGDPSKATGFTFGQPDVAPTSGYSFDFATKPKTAADADDVTVFEEGKVWLRQFNPATREWTDMGTHPLKVVQNTTTQAARIEMRTYKGTVVLNAGLFAGMTVELKRKSVFISLMHEGAVCNFLVTIPPDRAPDFKAEVLRAVPQE